MHPFSEKFPELNEPPLSEWCLLYKQLNSFPLDDQNYILHFIFAKLASAFGGFHFFWESEEQANYMIEGWRSCLCDLNLRQLTVGLYSIVTLQTEYIARPPRSGIEFHKLCKDASPRLYDKLNIITNPSNLLERENASDDERRLRSEAAKEQCLKTVKKLLSGNFYEKVDMEQTKTRSRPISKAFEDLGYS
jgi:hypothetical protein